MAFPKKIYLKAIPDNVLRLESIRPPEVVIPEKTGCGSVCKQKMFLWWFDSRGGTEHYKIYGNRKIMWADELWFGAFIEIWPVILVINRAELASLSESELILPVFLSPKQCWLLWNPQTAFVSESVFSGPLAMGRVACSDMKRLFVQKFRHDDAFWMLLQNSWKWAMPRTYRRLFLALPAAFSIALGILCGYSATGTQRCCARLFKMSIISALLESCLSARQKPKCLIS